MKRIVFTLIALALSCVSSQAATGDLFAYGAWPLCAWGNLGVLPAGSCSWYVPGQETYMLTIIDDGSGAEGYDYTINATLESGAVVSISGYVDRQRGGNTLVAPIMLGGIAASASVDVKNAHPVTGKPTAPGHGKGK